MKRKKNLKCQLNTMCCLIIRFQKFAYKTGSNLLAKPDKVHANLPPSGSKSGNF
jgi:hypothetical protein